MNAWTDLLPLRSDNCFQAPNHIICYLPHLSVLTQYCSFTAPWHTIISTHHTCTSCTTHVCAIHSHGNITKLVENARQASTHSLTYVHTTHKCSSSLLDENYMLLSQTVEAQKEYHRTIDTISRRDLIRAVYSLRITSFHSFSYDRMFGKRKSKSVGPKQLWTESPSSNAYSSPPFRSGREEAVQVSSRWGRFGSRESVS